MKATLDLHQFGQLRARIETTFSEPALIVITSAVRGDGKTATAFGLAEALGEAGRRVLYVDGNADAPILPRYHHLPAAGARYDFANISRHAKQVADQRFFGISLADERLEPAISMEDVKAAAFDMRSRFDFVVIDTAPVLYSDLAVLFAAISDGTLLTLRLGRLPVLADQETIKTLTHVGAHMLGVLTVTPNIIKRFASRSTDVAQRVLVPARHVTSRHTIEPDPREIAQPPKSNVVL